MKRNIIAVSSTHGCGKTTICYGIAHHLKKRGFNICVLDELARECPFEINQTAGWKTQEWLITTQIQRELILSEKYDYVIADRSVMDAVAYALCLNVLKKDDIYFVKNAIENIYRKVYILNPESFDYHIDDGVRDMDKKFRQDVHDILLKLHERHSVEKLVVNSEGDLIKDIDLIIES